MSLQIKTPFTSIPRLLAYQFADKRPILEAMGLQLTSITRRAFSDASLRPAPWAPHKYNYGGHSLLRKTGALVQSIRITELTGDHVTVGSDRKYAAMQQFGGTITPSGGGFLTFMIGNRRVFAKRVEIPPRPFFPFLPTGKMTATAEAKVKKVAEAKVASMLKKAGF